ncbi:eukaryotic translation initiation factor 3 subunit C-like isoform X2 [Catharus ustulatus]|uniref:eukaryotic translation initiation factor 3 subunit C-like isoform X1 n=1 Tax=Catharus ustulatus TaxID=91951 RepID=UPI001408CE4B|nr:eukaryotic translation initiation factor 3 subunit C-like isoform X1 [Catharus ustulatus]XP_032940447.1 eukaryotic translation initiation factor 3 subunit C-like isoform X2 [Catharus ustulatus]
MSRFFTTGSDSESESSASGDETAPKAPGGPYSKPLLLSEDEEDTKRVVRSARDKRYEELTNLIRSIRNAMKIRDVSRCLEEFELLGRAWTKAKGVVDRDGVPRFYLRILADLEDYLNELWEDKEGKKKMNKNNAKALSSLRQKLRKHNRDYEGAIAAYRQNPEQSDEDEEKSRRDSEGSASSSGAEDDAGNFLKRRDREEPRGRYKEEESESESESDEDWGDSASESDSESDEDDGKFTSLASKFLKKDEERRGAERRREEKAKKKLERKSRREEEEEEEEGGEWEKVKCGVPLVKEKPKMFAKGTEITVGLVVKKLNEILQARGKKGTDRAAQIELLQHLVAVAHEHNLGVPLELKIKFNIVASLYDYNPNLAAYMKPELWQKCLGCIEELLELLFAHPEIFVGENVLEESENLSNPEQPFRVRGCVLTLVERMDEEFTKIMQNTDPHSQEYVEHLKDEARVCAIIARLQRYLQGKGSPEELCRVYLRRVLHTYYKFDYGAARRKGQVKDGAGQVKEGAGQVKEGQGKEEEKLEDEQKVKEDAQVKENEAQVKDEEEEEEDSEALMERLCRFVYAKDRTDRIRTCAILCHIYHHALHSRWYRARDLMLMSHLQDNIQHADPPVQILYNRTMVQLGICAFRQGLIKDAHNALLDIQSSGRAKELLGQGLLLRSLQERNAEQEKVEKRRQVPFHMHVNLELLECVYLVAAMLLEIPYMAAHEFDARRRMISKQFHHQLRVGERQPLLGPPESMREHVVAASKAMKTGDWRRCHRFVVNEKMNGKVWDLFPEADQVRAMLVRKIQEESLRTYLFTYSSVYDSISMETLAAMFELDLPTVHGIISKMIINEELMASLDQPTATVMMHRTEPTATQNLALQLAEKLGNLVENNERVLDQRQGAYGGYFRDQKDGGYRKGDGYLRRGGFRQERGNY